MSIYSKSENGTKLYRTKMPLSYRYMCDIPFGRAVPIMRKFCLPGDIWRDIGANVLIRYQPTLSPVFTRSWARVRYFFVPLRLVEPDTELIITGSKNGTLPILPSTLKFKGMFEEMSNSAPDLGFTVQKYSFLDYLGIPAGINYRSFKNDECLPASYWYKGYNQIRFDFYRDENLETVTEPKNYYDTVLRNSIGQAELFPVNLHKDYFTSSLPWQLKGTTPTFEITINNPFQDDVSLSVPVDDKEVYFYDGLAKEDGFSSSPTLSGKAQVTSDRLNRSFNPIAGSFNMDDLRTMAAQTRVFERLARCGSRYTEYLHSNFGTAPADGTLQRAQYLGGFSQPIVVTEIPQTAQDGQTPVGTLRGKGISAGGNKIKPFVCKEFGMLFGLLDVMPELQYTQGISRELSYKKRFDFFNPSFQHLSEQEVRNGELYIGADGKNDDTFGFQAYGNELRSSQDMVVGDLRDGLSYWTQALQFNERPKLNKQFVSAGTYDNNFKRPFVVQSGIAQPMILDCYNILNCYRPMVKYGTPGLIDHL